jgi:hypothetical protein
MWSDQVKVKALVGHFVVWQLVCLFVTTHFPSNPTRWALFFPPQSQQTRTSPVRSCSITTPSEPAPPSLSPSIRTFQPAQKPPHATSNHNQHHHCQLSATNRALFNCCRHEPATRARTTLHLRFRRQSNRGASKSRLLALLQAARAAGQS